LVFFFFFFFFSEIFGDCFLCMLVRFGKNAPNTQSLLILVQKVKEDVISSEKIVESVVVGLKYLMMNEDEGNATL